MWKTLSVPYYYNSLFPIYIDFVYNRKVRKEVVGVQELWKKTLDLIKEKKSIDKDGLQWVVSKSKLLSIDENLAAISYGHIVTKNILEQSLPIFESALSEVYGVSVSIQLIDEATAKKYNLYSTEKEKIEKSYSFEVKSAKLDDYYTFEEFVRGQSNAEAYAACLQCSKERNQHMFNPIMLYGNPGLGKTHLLQAIGHYVKKERPECKVYYEYANQLVSLILDAMRSSNVHGNNVEDIKNQLAQYDYFLIDDIQNLKQSSSQEVFFSIYNSLIKNNAQIVMTSDMHPNDLVGIQERLISRFRQGLTINISKPEFDTSKAILKKKLEGNEETCLISDDVLDYLANKFSDDVRNLEGSLNKLIFNATIENPDLIDMDFAQRILMKEPVLINQDELTTKEIKKAVTRFYGLSYKDIEGKSRQKKIMHARHIFVYLCREYLHKPYVSIGQEIGNRDHTTISSSYERACQLIETDDAFKMAVDEVKKILKVD